MIAGVAAGGRAQSPAPKEPTATISGKVTLKGEPVPGVAVTLRLNDRSSRKLTNYRGVTDAKGSYRITNVAPGNYIVFPAAAALVSEDVSDERTLIVDKAEAIEDVDFSLIRGGVITGRVIDSDGQPLIEQEVNVFSTRDSRVPLMRLAATTDDRGVYRIFGLRPGSYTVAAGTDSIGNTSQRQRGGLYSRTYYPAAPDPAQATVIKVSDEGEATNIDIVLGRPLTTHTASGRVVNGATGQPVPNVGYGVIHYVSPTSTVSMNQGAVTNSRGEFKLENLIPGQYAVSVKLDDGSNSRADEARFAIVDQDVIGLVVTTVKGGSLSGVVVLDGIADRAIREQLRNARVIVSVITDKQRTPGQAFAGAVTADGSFRVGGLPSGNALISLALSPQFRIVRVERDGIIQLRGVEVKQGEDVSGLRIVVGYGDATLRGTVVIENGTIPANGRLFLRARRTDNPNPAWIDASAQMDARGQFVLENMLPGTYEISVGLFVPGSSTPLVLTKQEVVVTAGSTTTTSLKLDFNSPQPKP